MEDYFSSPSSLDSGTNLSGYSLISCTISSSSRLLAENGRQQHCHRHHAAQDGQDPRQFRRVGYAGRYAHQGKDAKGNGQQ